MKPTHRLLLVITLTALGVGACENRSTETPSVDVEIEVEIGGSQRWSTSDRRSGSICDGGSHRQVGYRMVDGSQIEYAEAVTLQQTEPAQVLIETQLGCSDGTGAISIAWNPDEHNRWMVVGGSGAYSGLTGAGRVEDGDAEPGGPKVLLGELSTG